MTGRSEGQHEYLEIRALKGRLLGTFEGETAYADAMARRNKLAEQGTQTELYAVKLEVIRLG